MKLQPFFILGLIALLISFSQEVAATSRSMEGYNLICEIKNETNQAIICAGCFGPIPSTCKEKSRYISNEILNITSYDKSLPQLISKVQAYYIPDLDLFSMVRQLNDSRSILEIANETFVIYTPSPSYKTPSKVIAIIILSIIVLTIIALLVSALDSGKKKTSPKLDFRKQKFCEVAIFSLALNLLSILAIFLWILSLRIVDWEKHPDGWIVFLIVVPFVSLMGVILGIIGVIKTSKNPLLKGRIMSILGISLGFLIPLLFILFMISGQSI